MEGYKQGGLFGVHVSLKGRQGKGDRSTELRWTKGKIKRNHLNLRTQSSRYELNTKTGVVRLKVELLTSVLSEKITASLLLNNVNKKI